MNKKRVLVALVLVLIILLILTKDEFYAGYPYLPYTSKKMSINFIALKREPVIITDRFKIQEFMNIVKKAKPVDVAPFNAYNTYRNSGGKDFFAIGVESPYNIITWEVWSLDNYQNVYMYPINSKRGIYRVDNRLIDWLKNYIPEID